MGVDHGDEADVRAVIEAERRRTLEQIAALERNFDSIVSAAELTSTDDEHDPEGATIAYERAQVWALLRQAREDLVALDQALVRVEFGTATICSVCGGQIAVERVLALPAVRVCINCAS